MPRPRKSSGGRASGRTASKKPSRASVEVVEEEAGLGIAEGVILATSVVLLAAFLMLDKARGGYGEGMFFKNQASQSTQ